MSKREELFRDFEVEGEDERPVTTIELFFDVVFVCCVTQLSHHLVKHLDPAGAANTLILFLAVWWLWMYTSWATNWLDPERGPVRLMLMVMGAGGLALSATIPHAFEKSGLLFAALYVTMQIGRTLFVAWAARGHDDARVRNFGRIAFYFALAAPLWITGGLSEGWTRATWWIGALAIEYAGPLVRFWTPFLGRSRLADWDISGTHMAERCALFIIIALGESILVTGATFAEADVRSPAAWAAFVTAFAASAAMWWIYFDVGAKRATEVIESPETSTPQIARSAYTYLHLPIVAGLIVNAVADEMMVAHPLDAATLPFVLAACGGPLIFLMGTSAFKWITSALSGPPLSHAIGMVALIIVGALSLWSGASALAVGAGAMAVLILTASWEWLLLHGGWARWAPWLGRRRGEALETLEAGG